MNSLTYFNHICTIFKPILGHVHTVPLGGVVKNYNCRETKLGNVKTIARVAALHPSFTSYVHQVPLADRWEDVTQYKNVKLHLRSCTSVWPLDPVFDQKFSQATDRIAFFFWASRILRRLYVVWRFISLDIHVEDARDNAERGEEINHKVERTCTK
jgi:hypothetical protein